MLKYLLANLLKCRSLSRSSRGQKIDRVIGVKHNFLQHFVGKKQFEQLQRGFHLLVNLSGACLFLIMFLAPRGCNGDS